MRRGVGAMRSSNDFAPEAVGAAPTAIHSGQVLETAPSLLASLLRITTGRCVLAPICRIGSSGRCRERTSCARTYRVSDQPSRTVRLSWPWYNDKVSTARTLPCSPRWTRTGLVVVQHALKICAQRSVLALPCSGEYLVHFLVCELAIGLGDAWHLRRVEFQVVGFWVFVSLPV